MEKENKDIRVIIPALNEENAVGQVIREIPKGLVKEVIVVDNNSKDNTFQVAQKSGATALIERRPGYGNACLKGINYLVDGNINPDIVVFLDGDHSDYPEEMNKIIEPIISKDFDLVIGSRALGKKEHGSMTPQQIMGNWLATTLIRLFYKVKYTDLGPFRAIKYQKLLDLGMKDPNYGWTVEMQLKAAKKGLKIVEVPVNYRKRIGVSKVSGTVKGTIGAGYKILLIIFRYL